MITLSAFIGAIIGSFVGVLIGNWIWHKLFHVKPYIPYVPAGELKVKDIPQQQTSSFVLKDWERREKKDAAE